MRTIPVITQVDLPLSDRCNLNCSFCYTKGGYGNSFSQAHVDKCFNWMLDQFDAGATPDQRKYGIRVTIYGGEPLMEWEHLKDVVVSKKAQSKARNINLQFSLVTNMTLLTADKLDWLLANNVGIHPSIDGCAQAQDAERKYADGRGTSAVVYENARRLLSKVPGRSCRMTISPGTVQYLYDSIVFLTRDIGFQTVNAVLAGGVDWTDEALEVHKQQIERVTDWWIDEMRQGRHWSLYHLRNMFMGIWNGRRMRGLCSSGVSHIGIDTAGNFYPCHRFCNLQSHPEYLLGTLDTGFTNLALRDTFKSYDLAAANKDRCKDCPAVLGCHALCLHEMMLAGNGMFEPLPHYCKVWPFYWQMALRAHSVLTAENNLLYLRTYDPRQNQRSAPSGARTQQVKRECSGKCRETGDGSRKMKVSIGQEIKYNVNEVSVLSVRVRKDKNAVLEFLVQYKWLDADGKTLRSDVARYTQAELATVATAQGQDITGLVAAITALIPTDGANQSLFVAMVREPFLFRGLSLTVVDGKNTWNTKTYKAEELVAAGLTPEAFKAAAALLASALTRA